MSSRLELFHDGGSVKFKQDQSFSFREPKLDILKQKSDNLFFQRVPDFMFCRDKKGLIDNDPEVYAAVYAQLQSMLRLLSKTGAKKHSLVTNPSKNLFAEEGSARDYISFY